MGTDEDGCSPVARFQSSGSVLAASGKLGVSVNTKSREVKGFISLTWKLSYLGKIRGNFFRLGLKSELSAVLYLVKVPTIDCLTSRFCFGKVRLVVNPSRCRILEARSESDTGTVGPPWSWQSFKAPILSLGVAGFDASAF
ncbi:hypothetical protein ACLOJK_021719 [Asimina triloba]